MTRPTVLDMDLVVVPREATDEMQFAGNANIYPAMLSSSPYPTAWDDVRKYVDGLEADVKREANLATTYASDCMDEQKRAEAAEARIAELEKRLADAERVIEPFAAVEPMNVWHETEEDEGYHSLTENQFRAARAYMEGK